VKAEGACTPTRPDTEGPFYKASALLRSKTGTGLIIEGTVKSSGTCEPIADARIEWWQTNPEGRYDDDHRGAWLTDNKGQYRIETDFPPPYSGRPSHVHFKVFAPGHRTLTTQVYPGKGQDILKFDFILIKN
jgi:protocatechuate 3,4-dioxygenase beta subunit